ncbi:hypothetical protein DMC30DRAFT_400378 [Rhodotorula diobovata]|uniref:Dynamitin-domain-containing protein n=1 Tax=Rhodotorula diobovata TaxID=5288 RepID=A0A5C5FRM1_9BASI|nr:hypothetical protein DMC30DRAFT_400378 [Rhodotorula diobovata]
MSKYATLPDIDTSGADVFETPDVPQEHSRARDTDSDDDLLPRSTSPSAYRRAHQRDAQQQPQPGSQDIDAQRLDAGDARRRFGEATRARLDRQQQRDDAARRPSRRLPPAREYVAHAPSSPLGDETPLERLRRLRLEMAELEDEVQRSAAAAPTPVVTEGGTKEADGKGDAAGDKGKKKREVSPTVILQQLQLLRGDLAGVAGVLEGEGEAGPAAAVQGAPDGELAQRAKQSAGLLARLGQAAAAPAPAVAGGGGPSEALMQPRGEAQEGALEKRVAELEHALGASGADVSELSPHPPPLLPTLSRLEHLVVLLSQPRHLDSISRRVKLLVSDLERIHDSRRKLGDTRPLNVALQGGVMTLSTGSGSGAGAAGAGTAVPGSAAGGGGGGGAPVLPPDAAQKLDALSALLPRLEPLVPLAPRLLARLRSLSALHSRAAAFGDELATVGGEVRRLREADAGLREVLEGLEGSVRENEERTRGNLESVERRVEEVVRRLDKLEELEA